MTNTGDTWAGKQVVGVYYAKPLSSFVRNHLSLLAFAKTDTLAPKASEVLQIVASVTALGISISLFIQSFIYSLNHFTHPYLNRFF